MAEFKHGQIVKRKRDGKIGVVKDVGKHTAVGIEWIDDKTFCLDWDWYDGISAKKLTESNFELVEKKCVLCDCKCECHKV